MKFRQLHFPFECRGPISGPNGPKGPYLPSLGPFSWTTCTDFSRGNFFLFKGKMIISITDMQRFLAAAIKVSYRSTIMNIVE